MLTMKNSMKRLCARSGGGGDQAGEDPMVTDLGGTVSFGASMPRRTSLRFEKSADAPATTD
jgi:hypothetical protein